MRAWKLEPTVELKPILTWCLEAKGADRLLVPNRLDYGAMTKRRTREFLDPAAVEKAREIFDKRILREVWVRNWPGTLSARTDGLVFVVALDVILIETMSAAQPKLFEWLGPGSPPLPEDLAAYRHGRECPCLFSVTHERDAWLLDDAPVPFKAVEVCKFEPEEFYVPLGEDDFVR